jgi:plastocyanin
MTVPCRLFSASPLILATFVISACSSAPPPPPPATGGGKHVDAATAGSIAGRIVFDGKPPAAKPIMMSFDQTCVQGAGPNPQSEAVIVAADGGVKNVFVHIKSGLDDAYSFEVPSKPAILDQKGCIYQPRVIGVRVGQPLEISNSDTTMHNVHSMPIVNQEFNKSTPVKGSRTTQIFTTAEVPVRFMCNVHNWMAAWVGVVPHPFFAVSDDTGAFSIAGVPPGKYVVEAWHEKFGTQTAEITVGEKQNGTLTFTFKPATTN